MARSVRCVVPAFCALALAANPAAAGVHNVSSFGDLYNTLMYYCSPGDEVILAAGDYHVTGALYVTKPNIIVRGATGNPDDVVLHGNGMNVDSGVREGFWAAADGIQLHDLTIKDFWHHGVHICGSELADNVVLSNLKIQNCGERYIKGSSPGISNNVLIENVHFLQTELYQPRPGHPVDENNYIGGIDAMQTNNWIVRDCRFEHIKGATGSGRGAIFMWQGCTNALIERNVILDCGTGIALGNGWNPDQIYHSENAMVRNNFIVHPDTGYVALDMGYTRNNKLCHNTVYCLDGDGEALFAYGSSSIPTADLVLENNILRGAIYDDASGTVIWGDNITGAGIPAEWFADPAAGDLHLTEQATGAIDQGSALPHVTDDIDGHGRIYGAAPDLGADEFIPEPAALCFLALGAAALFARRQEPNEKCRQEAAERLRPTNSARQKTGT